MPDGAEFDGPEGEMASTRYANHILRQHQFQQLCTLRKWRYSLMGDWDSSNTPYRELPSLGLVVMFDVGSDESVDRTAAGIDLTITTGTVTIGRKVEGYSDAVQSMIDHSRETMRLSPSMEARVVKMLTSRFAGMRTEPVSLRDVPLVVFSEIMRDIDLFVSVCSIGNSPTNAGFENNPLQAGYWKQFSFGVPTGTVKSRAAILNRLLSKIGQLAACTIEGRHLIVPGRLRTYRIHLGSGTATMEPGSATIVLKKGKNGLRAGIPKQDSLYLPFEGDELLFDILNTALVLTKDDQITDPALRKKLQKG
jgi:hypothetical protein